MTPPKREDRLNPMSRRKGRPPAAPPGPEWMVLAASVVCVDCGWEALLLDAEDALETWADHANREGHDINPPNYTLKGEI